jgi:hypothetical protein
MSSLLDLALVLRRPLLRDELPLLLLEDRVFFDEATATTLHVWIPAANCVYPRGGAIYALAGLRGP